MSDSDHPCDVIELSSDESDDDIDVVNKDDDDDVVIDDDGVPPHIKRNPDEPDEVVVIDTDDSDDDDEAPPTKKPHHGTLNGIIWFMSFNAGPDEPSFLGIEPSRCRALVWSLEKPEPVMGHTDEL